jgi:hypothetical protein
MEELTALHINSKLDEFKVIDRMAQRAAECDMPDVMGECHLLMYEIIKSLEPYKDDIYKDHPEFKEIFETFLKGYIREM